MAPSAGEVLVFGDAGVILRHRIIHHRNRLELLDIDGAVIETQRTVGQLAIAPVEELVDRTREDQPVVRNLILDLAVVGLQHDLDLGMLDHLLEHPGIAVQRHRLERVAEVAVVAVGTRGDTRRHRLVELRGVDAPLLARIAAEELLIELAANGADHHILGGLDLVHDLAALGEELLELLGREVETIELVDGVEVDGDGKKLPVNLRQHTMLIGAPLGEL